MATGFTSYRDLEGQNAMAIAKEVYAATAGFPDQERFGLLNQMRADAVLRELDSIGEMLRALHRSLSEQESGTESRQPDEV